MPSKMKGFTTTAKRPLCRVVHLHVLIGSIDFPRQHHFELWSLDRLVPQTE